MRISGGVGSAISGRSPIRRCSNGSTRSSPGPYLTYDIGGDVWQWNEADDVGSYRGLRGGSYFIDSDAMASSYRNSGYPTAEHAVFGFRVASGAVVPEPGSMASSLAFALALAIWRPRRTRYSARQ